MDIAAHPLDRFITRRLAGNYFPMWQDYFQSIPHSKRPLANRAWCQVVRQNGKVTIFPRTSRHDTRFDDLTLQDWIKISNDIELVPKYFGDDTIVYGPSLVTSFSKAHKVPNGLKLEAKKIQSLKPYKNLMSEEDFEKAALGRRSHGRFVYTLGNKIIGFGTIIPFMNHFVDTGILVLEEHRGERYAEMIFAHLSEEILKTEEVALWRYDLPNISSAKAIGHLKQPLYCETFVLDIPR